MLKPTGNKINVNIKLENGYAKLFLKLREIDQRNSVNLIHFLMIDYAKRRHPELYKSIFQPTEMANCND
jgi:hypothetical protein